MNKFLERLAHHTHVSGTLGLYMMMTWPPYFMLKLTQYWNSNVQLLVPHLTLMYEKSAIMMQLPQETQSNFCSNYLFPSYYTQMCKRKPQCYGYHKENHRFTIRKWWYHECT